MKDSTKSQAGNNRNDWVVMNKRLNFRKAIASLQRLMVLLEEKWGLIERWGGQAPVVLHLHSLLLVNLNGVWSAVSFKCTYQSRASGIYRQYEPLGLKSKEGTWMEWNTAYNVQSNGCLDHVFPSLPGACQMAVCLKPAHPCLPSLTHSPDNHCGTRNVDSVLQSRTPTGLRWWIALKHKLCSVPENKTEPVFFQ